VHTLRDLEYQNFGQFLVDVIRDLFERSSNKKYHDLLEFLDGV
jgi:hypothetical protein